MSRRPWFLVWPASQLIAYRLGTHLINRLTSEIFIILMEILFFPHMEISDHSDKQLRGARLGEGNSLHVVACHERRGFAPPTQVQLLQNIAHVGFDRVLAQRESCRDFAIGLTLDD